MGGQRGKLVAVSLGGLFVLSMCGSKPGTEVEGGAGGGRYSVFGCGIRSDYVEAGYKAGIHHQTESGFAVAANAGAARSELVGYDDGSDGPDPDDPLKGEISDLAWAGIRGGYHWNYGGFEAGPMVIFDGPTIDPGEPTGPLGASAFRSEGQILLVPSIDAWAGKRDGVFVWGELLREYDTARPALPIGIGIGHESWIHARGGLTLQGVSAEVAYPIGGPEAPVCVGVKGLLSENAGYWVGGTLTYRLGKPGPRKPKIVKPNPARVTPTPLPEPSGIATPDVPPPETPAPTPQP